MDFQQNKWNPYWKNFSTVLIEVIHHQVNSFTYFNHMEEKIKALEQRIAQLEEVVIILKDCHVEAMKGLVRLGEMNNEFVCKLPHK